MARVPRNSVKAENKPVTRPAERNFAAWFEQHQLNAVDSLLRLLLNPVASFLTWGVIGIALALPLSLVLLLQNMQQLGTGLDQISSISLYMPSGASTVERDELAAALVQRTDIAAVELVTAEEALVEFESESGFGNILQGLDENPLPAVFLVTPVRTDAAAVANLHATLSSLPGVEHAQLDLQWLQRLEALVELATRLAVILAAMLGIGVVLVIGNTVRLAIENRRAEIVVVKLVGATDAYVARPFLYTGLWYGVGGGMLAVLLISTAIWTLQAPIGHLMNAYNSDFSLIGLGISNSFIVLVCAGLLGWLGAWVSVYRNLRAIEPR